MEKSSLVHIGDTVRFLNETGEGRVIRFASHHELVVELSDGMEIPYPVNQVVVVKSEIQKEALNTNIQIPEGEIGQLNILLCEGNTSTGSIAVKATGLIKEKYPTSCNIDIQANCS